MAEVPSGVKTRGILCAPCGGKLYASVLREATMPAVEVLAGDGQFGALSGRGTTPCSFTVSCLVQWALAVKKPLCLLFTDVRSAFYSGLPEVVLGCLLQDGPRQSLLLQLGLSEAAALDFGRFVAGVPLVQQSGVSASWTRAIKDWHSATWFAVAGGDRRCDTMAGTKPGDPEADALFCMTFAVAVNEII